MSVNGQQASNWRVQKHLLAKCQVQLSLTIETQIFKYPMHIYFDQELSKQSYYFHNMTMDIKSRTSYDGTCFHK